MQGLKVLKPTSAQVGELPENGVRARQWKKTASEGRAGTGSTTRVSTYISHKMSLLLTQV